MDRSQFVSGSKYHRRCARRPPTSDNPTTTIEHRPRADTGVAPDRTGPSGCYVQDQGSSDIHSIAFAEIRRRYRHRESKIEQPSLLLDRVVDGLVDSFFPVLAAFDDRIDELEDAIVLKAGDEQLQEIFQMKPLLVGMRKAVSPQRDTFARLIGSELLVLATLLLFFKRRGWF